MIKADPPAKIYNLSEDDEEENKREFVYSNFKNLTCINQFFVFINTSKGYQTGLSDTGADNSLIYRVNLPEQISISSEKAKIRSASGELLNIIGRI